MEKRHLLLLGLLVLLELTSADYFWPKRRAQFQNKTTASKTPSRDNLGVETVIIDEIDSKNPDTNNSRIRVMKLIDKNAWSYTHDEFKNYPQLKTLIIANQQINSTWLSKKPYIFSSPTLTNLELRGLGLAVLPRRAFIKNPNLTRLSLARNDLKRLPRYVMRPLKQLQELDLSCNLIEGTLYFIENIESLPRLRTLNISHNYLGSLSAVRSDSLQTLDVSNNNIKAITEDDLVNLPELATFIMHGNRLTTVNPMAFFYSFGLRSLDLSYNEDLRSLPAFYHATWRETDMNYLNCSNCGLTSIDPRTFEAMPNIMVMDLSYNLLETVSGAFKVLHMLKTLSLAHNKISYIPDDMFDGADSLTDLSLSGNPLKSMSVTPFLAVGRLQTLFVDDCRLEQIWDLSESVLGALKFLAARGNRIKRVTGQEMAVMPNLKYLGLFNNPLVCGEDYSNLQNWTMSKKIVSLVGNYRGQAAYQLCYQPGPEESFTKTSEVGRQKPLDVIAGVAVNLINSIHQALNYASKNQTLIQQEVARSDPPVDGATAEEVFLCILLALLVGLTILIVFFTWINPKLKQRSWSPVNSRTDRLTRWREVVGLKKPEDEYKAVKLEGIKYKVVNT